MARPRKNDGFTHTTTIRMKPEEAERLKRLSDKHGTSGSDCLRGLLNRSYDRSFKK